MSRDGYLGKKQSLAADIYMLFLHPWQTAHFILSRPHMQKNLSDATPIGLSEGALVTTTGWKTVTYHRRLRTGHSIFIDTHDNWLG